VSTPDFDALTPPPELVREWCERGHFWSEDITTAYQAGARHGYELGRQPTAAELREQALAVVHRFETGDDFITHEEVELIRRALLNATEPPAPVDGLSDEKLDALWWKAIEAPDVVAALGRSGFRWAARELLARYVPPRAEPVAVTERLPGVGDLKDDHCWWGYPAGIEDPEDGRLSAAGWAFVTTMPGSTHWLPWWALPLPEPQR
jgi:hypothetical protein